MIPTTRLAAMLAAVILAVVALCAAPAAATPTAPDTPDVAAGDFNTAPAQAICTWTGVAMGAHVGGAPPDSAWTRLTHYHQFEFSPGSLDPWIHCRVEINLRAGEINGYPIYRKACHDWIVRRWFSTVIVQGAADCVGH